MRDVMDWIEAEKPLEIRPIKTGRTQLQIVMTVEDAWLSQFLIQTDGYICPSEAMVKVRTRGAR